MRPAMALSLKLRRGSAILGSVRWPMVTIQLLLCGQLLGCYFAEAAGTQLWLINAQVPLDAAISSEADPERRAMLASVAHVRAFARDVMQLRPDGAYAGYVHTEAEGLTHVVVASERLRLQPFTWWFPIAGRIDYKSHFSAARAHAEADALAARGYDTWVGHSRAYSTLGILRDPVVTTMMHDGLLSFMEVLLHEMTHARLYVPGETDFNEQLASFAADRGMRQLLAAPRFRGTGLSQAYAAEAKRRERFEAEVARSIETLEALYARGLPEAEVMRRRQVVFDALSARLDALARARGLTLTPDAREMNNARLLQWKRYGRGVDLFSQMWQRAGGSWPRFWRRVEQHAQDL